MADRTSVAGAPAEYLIPLVRMGRDVKKAAQDLSDAEARFLVDAYYAQQKFRIGQNNMFDRLTESGEPNAAIRWLADQSDLLENQVKGALDRYSMAHGVGQWMRSVKGIGPVIAAGYLAHIDITKAPTVGHIWRFAGLDPTLKWRSSEFVRGQIAAARKAHKGDDWAIVIELADEFSRHPLDLLVKTEAIEALPSIEAATDVVSKIIGMKIKPKAQFHPDNVLREIVPRDRLGDAYRALGLDIDIRWEAVAKLLSKRPWNARLKVLAWKTGQSFVKVSGGDDPGFYGVVYRDRKILEVQRNEAGRLADQAAASLAGKTWRDGTDAKRHYEAGKLPPARLELRAQRYAVKLFLSHLHHVWHTIHFGRPPVKPYILTQGGGHAHEIPPPNWPAG